MKRHLTLRRGEATDGPAREDSRPIETSSEWPAGLICCTLWLVKLFYTGPVINTEMLVMMLEKHGIPATQEFLEAEGDAEDLNRQAMVLVPEADYDRAYRLFYAEREDEL
jgi:hypothetical protein